MWSATQQRILANISLISCVRKFFGATFMKVQFDFCLKSYFKFEIFKMFYKDKTVTVEFTIYVYLRITTRTYM